MIENEKIAEALKLMNKTAIMEIAAGNYQKALEIFKQSLILEKSLGLKLQSAESMVNIGNTYYLMKEYDKSMEVFTEVYEIFKKEQNVQGVYKIQQMFAGIHFMKKEFEKAAEIYEKSIRMNIGSKEKAEAYYLAAATYFKANNSYRAQDYLTKALAEFERNKDNNGMVNCLRQRALMFKSKGRKDLALSDLRRSAEIAKGNEELMKEIQKQIDEMQQTRNI
jgi:tetratricopeptide (TPR) repeat protein